MSDSKERADFQKWWDGCKVVRTAEARHAAWQAWQARAQQQAASAVPVAELPPLPEPFGEMKSQEEWGRIYGYSLKQMRAYAREALRIAAAATPTVPDGWQLVPKEPTKEMVQAACTGHGYPAGDRTIYARGYKTMIAAAPTPTVPADVMADAERRFPMQRGPSIPWSLAEAIYAGYSALYGKGQSLERLAERGGFSWREVEVIYNDRDTRSRTAIDAAIARAAEKGTTK